MAYNNMATAFTKLGQIDKAVRSYKKVLQIKPDYAEVHYHLAILLLKQDKKDEAHKHFQEALRLKPELTQTQKYLDMLKPD